jgi:hypothetical protein
VLIQSRAAPQEVVAELTRSIERERPNLLSSSGFAGDGAFVGRVDGQRFRIQRRQTNHNGFAPQAYGNVLARDGGAAIDYTIAMHRMTQVGVVVLLLFFVALDAAFVLRAPPPSPGALSPALWTLLALVGGGAFIVFARWGWDREVAALHRFISEVSDRASRAGRATV